MKTFYRAIALGSLLSPSLLMAHQDDSPPVSAINAHLQRFSENTAKEMDATPERWNEDGTPVSPSGDLLFNDAEIDSGEAFAAKDAARGQMCMVIAGKLKCLGLEAARDARSVIQGNDRPEELVDGHAPIRSLVEMESRGLRKSRLASSPWSDDYWATYRGIVGARYADPSFPDKGEKDWLANFNYINQHPASGVIASGDDRQIDLLSPSEKYALLIGDSDDSLTSALWRKGKRYHDSLGYVPSWVGICHGWAAASIAVPRPKSSLNLLAADGKTTLHFYPSDTKGLVSLLWALKPPDLRFIGGRCRTAKPAKDDNGRILQQECFDTNPGTWHIALINQIGVARRSFILDASYDYKVWNQPAYGYSYWYFNPQTNTYVDTLSEATVPMKKFTHDPFSKYRSSNAAAVVGVAMDFTYVYETKPSHAAQDSPKNDAFRTVRYYYDLELDSSGKIVGGEWHHSAHPDFLWTTEEKRGSPWVGSGWFSPRWSSPDSVMPKSWREDAKQAAKAGRPLDKIVEQIINWAQK